MRASSVFQVVNLYGILLRMSLQYFYVKRDSTRVYTQNEI